jgi:Flp pilus assembly protein TadD
MNPRTAVQPLIHNRLGIAHVRTGRTDEAIREFQEAIRLKPDYADARNNLGVAVATKDQLIAAVLHREPNAAKP